MKIEELQLSGDGKYDIGITVEPMPHLRLSRLDDDGYREGITLLAKVRGGTFLGTNKNNSYEVNLMAPYGVEDHSGDNIILASFEFHSLQLDSAYNGILHFTGFLSAAEAHSKETYDALAGLSTTEEFERIPALTTSTGRLKYLPPLWEEAQQFLGWQAKLTVRPHVTP
jgi:hypothetical protein